MAVYKFLSYRIVYANRFRTSPTSPNILVDQQDNAITDSVEIANLLQRQFMSVFTSPFSKSVISNYEMPEITLTTPLPPFNITEKDIISSIDEIRANSRCARGDIPAKVFKECKFSLCKPLSMFWERSLQCGQIPSGYKIQSIVPIYKKGLKTKPENFRPVVLTPHEIKIMERVLRKKLTEHLEINSLININQHGFRHNHSCSTQLLSHLYYIYSHLIEGDQIDSIYIDYAKAFDKVDHGLLIKKLKCYGITGKVLIWIENFLHHRSQTVFVNNCHSFPTSVQSGVPQGSVLGPLLFIIYINDLLKSIRSPSSRIFTFADDTKIVSKISSTSDHTNLQNDLNNTIAWSKLNNMDLNHKKLELISHKLRTDNANLLLFKELPFHSVYDMYHAGDTMISPSVNVRDLGIFLDSMLDWRFHYSKIVSKAKQLCGWILCTFRTRDKTTMLTLYNALVRSRLEYCCEIWSPHLNKDINYIENIQRSFTFKISGMKEFNYWQRLKKLKLMSLQRRREKMIVSHVWKIKNGHFPNSND